MFLDREFPLPVHIPRATCANPHCDTVVRIRGEFCRHCERMVQAERVLLRVKKAEATQ